MVIDKKDFVDHLYSLLPAVYRDEDSKIGIPLYRYLTCLGYDWVIEDSNNFLTLVDPEKCPEEVFPYLYESFGLSYYPDIPIEYHRRFLSNIGALVKRRGTESAIVYLVTTLTASEVELAYRKEFDSEGKISNKFLDVVLKVNTLEEVIKLFPSTKIVEQFIKSQLPFNINPVVSAVPKTENIEAKDHKAIAIQGEISYEIFSSVK